jgi:transposase
VAGSRRPTREHLAGWLRRFDGEASVAFAVEAGTGWRYVVEEMRTAGVEPHLAEPADTSALRGPKRRAKTDKADAKLLRELLADGRVPECYIPPSPVLEWRGMLELYHDLRTEHTGWAQRTSERCRHAT